MPFELLWRRRRAAVVTSKLEIRAAVAAVVCILVLITAKTVYPRRSLVPLLSLRFPSSQFSWDPAAIGGGLLPEEAQVAVPGRLAVQPSSAPTTTGLESIRETAGRRDFYPGQVIPLDIHDGDLREDARSRIGPQDTVSAHARDVNDVDTRSRNSWEGDSLNVQHSLVGADVATGQGSPSSSHPGSQSDSVDASPQALPFTSESASNESDDSLSEWLDASEDLPPGADPLAELAKLTPDLASLLSDLNEAGVVQEEDTEGALSSGTPLQQSNGNTGGGERSSVLIETQGGQEYMDEMRAMVRDTLFNPLERPLTSDHYCYNFPPLSIRPDALRPCAVCYLPTVAAARAVQPSLPHLHEKSEAAAISSLAYQTSANAAEATASGKLQPEVKEVDDMFAGPLALRQQDSPISVDKRPSVCCGFYSQQHQFFSMSDEDKRFIAGCKNIVVASAVFGGHNTPAQLSASLKPRKDVCFVLFVDRSTASQLQEGGSSFLATQRRKLLDTKSRSRIRISQTSSSSSSGGGGNDKRREDSDSDRRHGLWRAIVVDDLPYADVNKSTVALKLLLHRFFPSSLFSLWLNPGLQLREEPHKVLERFLWRDSFSFALPRSQITDDAFTAAALLEESDVQGREQVRDQMEAYRRGGMKRFSLDKQFPLVSGVPDTSVLLRAHTPLSNLLSCLWFNEVACFTHYDHISFAAVRDRIKKQAVTWKVNLFNECERRNFARPPPPSDADPTIHSGGAELGATDFAAQWWKRVRTAPRSSSSTGRYNWGRANLSAWEAEEARRLLSETVFNPMEPPLLPGSHTCSSFPAAAVVADFQRPAPVCYLPSLSEATAAQPSLESLQSHEPVLRRLSYVASTDKAELAAVRLHRAASEEREEGGEGKEGGEGVSRLFEGHQTLKQRRRSMVVQQRMKVHCGFVWRNSSKGVPYFSMSRADRAFLHSCSNIVVVSAVFGAYDDIREPTRLTPTPDVCYVMFVDAATLAQHQSLDRLLEMRRESEGREEGSVSVWRLVLVDNLPSPDIRKSRAAVKMLIHRFFPASKFSLWIDGKDQLLKDPRYVLERFLWRGNFTFATSRHVSRDDVFEESDAVTADLKCSKAAADAQMEAYRANGMRPFTLQDKFPIVTDVPDSSVIMRAHTPLSNLLSCVWYNEIMHYTQRDQLSFGFVRDRILRTAPGWRINMFSDSERRNFARLLHHAIRNVSKSERAVVDEDHTRGEFLSQAHIMFSST